MQSNNKPVLRRIPVAKLKNILHLLSVNWRTMAGFELLYKFLSLTIVTSLFWTMFNGILKITGYEYLTKENILSFLLNPVTIAALLLLFLCMAIYTMLDIGAVIFLLDQSYLGHRVSLPQTAAFALKNARRVFQRRNFSIAFVVLFLIPFLNIGVASSYVSSISVPEFILDFIAANKYLLVLFLIVLAGLAALLLRWLYAFHYFTLEGCGFKEARKKSARLSHKNKRKDIGILLGTQFLIALIFLLLNLLGIVLAVLLGKLFSSLHLLGIVSASVVWVFLAISAFLMSALGTPVSYACISFLFYGHKNNLKEEVVRIQTDGCCQNRRKRSAITALEIFLFTCCVFFCSLYLYGVYHHKISLPVEHFGTMEVTAHRGASRFYPENTMAAFDGAKKLGADWIELDVQQSKDGQIFVMHDTNFKRTAGIDCNTWELSYDTISRLDVGSFFDPKFAGEKVPLLTEAIAFAKENHIMLNIELKPTGYETDFEKTVVDMINQENFRDHCVITSQVYEVLEHVKAYDPQIQTVYVMSIAYGNINRLSAADNFSIEATSVTEKIVSDVHNAGKQLYAWTVNTQDNISRMIDLGVDNIITDDVTLAKECIYLSKTSDVFAEYIKWLSQGAP